MKEICGNCEEFFEKLGKCGCPLNCTLGDYSFEYRTACKNSDACCFYREKVDKQQADNFQQYYYFDGTEDEDSRSRWR